MSKGFASSGRMVLLGSCLLLCYGALGVRLVWLHVVDRDTLLKPLAKVRPMLIPEAARRGDILDARGARLATSRSEIVLGVDPHSLVPRDERKWAELAALVELPEAELRQRFVQIATMIQQQMAKDPASVQVMGRPGSAPAAGDAAPGPRLVMPD